MQASTRALTRTQLDWRTVSSTHKNETKQRNLNRSRHRPEFVDEVCSEAGTDSVPHLSEASEAVVTPVTPTRQRLQSVNTQKVSKSFTDISPVGSSVFMSGQESVWSAILVPNHAGNWRRTQWLNEVTERGDSTVDKKTSFLKGLEVEPSWNQNYHQTRTRTWSPEKPTQRTSSDDGQLCDNRHRRQLLRSASLISNSTHFILHISPSFVSCESNKR